MFLPCVHHLILFMLNDCSLWVALSGDIVFVLSAIPPPALMLCLCLCFVLCCYKTLLNSFFVLFVCTNVWPSL